MAKNKQTHILAFAILIIICIVIYLIFKIKYTTREFFESESSGLNEFIDVVYYINLEHRKDRKEQIERELKKTGITNIQRIPAVYNKENGAMGCTASHINTLKTFIESGKNRCLILEDDFVFSKSNSDIRNILENIKSLKFDVLMLSGNVHGSKNVESNKYIKRVLDAQTTSGYIVTREFAPTLLSNFEDGLALFRQHSDRGWQYALDMFWKRLQPTSEWYITNPAIGKQSESYSDIEGKTVDYGV